MVDDVLQTSGTSREKIVTGLILEENDGASEIDREPVGQDRATDHQEVGDRALREVTTSIMPKGLLDELTRDEILDLIAHITARGDQHHMLFHGGHQH